MGNQPSSLDSADFSADTSNRTSKERALNANAIPTANVNGTGSAPGLSQSLPAESTSAAMDIYAEGSNTQGKSMAGNTVTSASVSIPTPANLLDGKSRRTLLESYPLVGSPITPKLTDPNGYLLQATPPLNDERVAGSLPTAAIIEQMQSEDVSKIDPAKLPVGVSSGAILCTFIQ